MHVLKPMPFSHTKMTHRVSKSLVQTRLTLLDGLEVVPALLAATMNVKTRSISSW
jgi:hypothetical protein